MAASSGPGGSPARQATAASPAGSIASIRAAADSRDARAMTASRTVAGTSIPPPAITSRMKNGLPPVRRCSSSASPPASTRVAARLSGTSSILCTPGRRS
jgi:hypothetical protein